MSKTNKLASETRAGEMRSRADQVESRKKKKRKNEKRESPNANEYAVMVVQYSQL
jgi:hypothetical protein